MKNTLQVLQRNRVFLQKDCEGLFHKERGPDVIQNLCWLA